jgi:phosphate starvation-inducible PhoH-like protein
VESFLKYREKGVIEVAPLAYMRGRTLDDSFIILDEAQNTTPEQMKMFLTRMGFGSKVVITGDITQIDLPRAQFSGLVEIMSVLKDIPEIAFIYLSDQDVVRHNLVQKIIKAYEKYQDVKNRGSG